MLQESALQKSILIGFACAIATVILWSGNFVVARGLSDSIGPFALSFWRWLVAVIFLMPFALKPLLKKKSWLKENIAYLVLVSALGITIFNALIYYAGRTSSAINLSLIAITFPIFILILSRIFLAEKISWNKLVGIVLVIAGVLLLVSKGQLSVLKELEFAVGDLLMLLAALIFAVYSMLLKRMPAGIKASEFQLASFILGLVFIVPFYLLELYFLPAQPFEQTTILSILYVGVFSSLVAFILWSKAIAYIGAVNAGMVYYSMPVFSGTLAIWLLGESVTIFHLYSTLLIFLGIILAVVYKPKAVS